MKTHWKILVVDDEEVMCESLAAWLREDGYAVDTASSGREAVDKSNQRDYAIYFVDLKMPGGMDGIETMMQIRSLHPEASIIIITAYATVDTAIAAMKEGAQEYIVKPCNPEEISLLVSRIVKVKNLQRENAILRKKLTHQYSAHDVISKNPRMRQILELAGEVASLRSTVLITRRKRHRQRVDCARDAHFRRPRAEALRGGLLRRAGRDACSNPSCSAMRKAPSPARRAETRQIRNGQRRHDLPGRNRRHLTQAPSGPVAGASGALLLPRGRD